MRERFTENAEKVLKLAKKAAKNNGNGYIGSEHLLLGLLEEGEGTAAILLKESGADTVKIRTLVANLITSEGDTLTEETDYTPRTEIILENAVHEADFFHMEKVGTEHLLLALLKDTECVATRLLHTMEIDIRKLYLSVLSAMGIEESMYKELAQKEKARRDGGATPVLDQYSRDLTEMAAEGELDPIVGRDAEIERILQILSRRTKNNPCLIGEPGVGKSTMLLQLCGAISNQHTVLYITGEESVRQVKLRAARLKVPQDNIYLAAENDVDEICGLIEKEKPELVVIDSIQTMRCMDISSSAGTVSQVKESAARLLAVAKKQEIPMFIVGHVNKDGAIAGPKVMEHIVDTVLYFEGDKMLPYRILRAAKNRYGSTNELGMFDMTGQGLEEIENPSQMLLEGRPLGVSGNCVACTMEGSRPILSEIQALATKTNFPAPRRACSGYDYNRMNLLIAVLEKRAGYFFGNLDVYINIVSGITLRDTACDLAVCLSMVSSLLDCPVSDKLIAIGEVGLGGEVRSVPNLEQRLREAERIGFERAVVPKHSLSHLNAADYPGMKLVGAAYISDAIRALKSDRL